MSETPGIGAFAIVPNNDLPAAIPFWERLGFARTGGSDNYSKLGQCGLLRFKIAGEHVWTDIRPGRYREFAA